MLVNRRAFISRFAVASVALPVEGRAQQQKMPTIGFLGANAAAAQSQWTAAFVRRLHDLGWIEGRTVAIEYRWAEGRSERYIDIAKEFVRLKVDVIFTAGNEAAIAAKRATSAIPIVFGPVGDPVGTGLVATLARPGGNVTGLSIQQTDLASKRLELLREVIPAFRDLAIMVNVGSANSLKDARAAETIALALGLEVLTLEIRRAEDIAVVLKNGKGRLDAMYVVGDPLMNTNRARVAALALAARLPAIYGLREFVDVGGLMSYGPNFQALFRRAAEYVDKILRGAKPADLPVEQPTLFELIINLKTAAVLDLTIPQSLLLRADEII